MELLLRGLDPSTPRAGACGRYRFRAAEPTGPRELTFEACVVRVDPDPQGTVVLRLSSGDSLAAWLEVGKEFFAGRGAARLESVRALVEASRGDTTRVARSEWASLPGLDAAPPLPGARDSLLGERMVPVTGTTLRCQGHSVREESRTVRELGEVTMTQVLRREIECWNAAEAPLLGLVHARATISSEKDFSEPVPGVPLTGRRTWSYELELIAILPGPGTPQPPR